MSDDDKLEHKRRLGRERQRRRRELLRNGSVMVLLKIDAVAAAAALAAEGMIDPWRDDDPAELERGLRLVFEAWLKHHAGEA